jgi:hypothetical protein
MADCECLAGCIFFNDKMASRPATANTYKRHFCQEDSTTCARYMVFKARGKGSVPSDLYPNQQDRAKTIIAAG